ncbi:sulfite exporter TauE/SafE family protein [Agriterribacter sp.]|uniref:sulfite exporter TauE/SafE family protein n=1 Tax=Agriterribacter sp. TaxID=2821509 RepID=UPI002CF9C24F|nr:sulfite exporter TauE/SafE family protein [Agriterribacter sp.]HRO46259.1 sulfite exporter TauE/SafE family protein [Agriterribacter sp.]HRQ18407.1 sulfite exporter TauE/SafE family protein [Agriterribacter sp.]
MELIGYITAVLIGVSLGLIGGGGSILTVPLLVYVFRLPPVIAVSYSLFIVGTTSLLGAFDSFRKGQASLNLALPLGIVSPATVFFVRRYVVPHIPEQLWTAGRLEITKSVLTMILFAVLMLAAAVSMLKKTAAPSAKTPTVRSSKDYFHLGLFGLGIGCVTGFLGAGGGFLIIPALVLLLKLPMKEAVGTSLFIIAINSLVGFTGDLGHYVIDWFFLLCITAIASVGILIGAQLAKKIPSEKLKRGFGWFVLVMGMYIIVQEVMILWG